MSDTSNSQDWDNYWSGRKGDDSGSVLEGVGVEKDPRIKAFWTQLFEGADTSAAVLDLCCGAGSVIRAAKPCGYTNLTGADISPAAIKTLKSEFPDVTTVVTPADNTPFGTDEFSHVVSQYGFEYAGAIQTAPEIARVLSKGGQFTALSHIQGGEIEAECAGKLADVNTILSSGFIQKSVSMFKAAFGSDEAVFNAATREFRSVQMPVLEIAKARGGLAGHLYAGTQQLYGRIEHHSLQDILTWFDGMEAEIKAFHGRMQSMVDVAMTEADVAAFYAKLMEHGCTPEPAEILKLEGSRAIAWILKAVKL